MVGKKIPEKKEAITDALSEVSIKLEKLKELMEETKFSTKEIESFALVVIDASREKADDDTVKAFLRKVEKAVEDTVEKTTDKALDKPSAKEWKTAGSNVLDAWDYLGNINHVLKSVASDRKLMDSRGLTEKNISNYISGHIVTSIDWPLDPTPPKLPQPSN